MPSRIRRLVAASLLIAHLPGGPLAERAGAEPRSLTLPGRSWSLVVDLPGFEFSRRETSDDGSRITVAGENPQTHLAITIVIEETRRASDARACRARIWKRARRQGPPKSGVRMSERGDMALVEYLIEEWRGLRVDHKNVRACLAHDGTCIEVHLAKPGFSPGEETLFEAVIGTVRVDG